MPHERPSMAKGRTYPNEEILHGGAIDACDERAGPCAITVEPPHAVFAGVWVIGEFWAAVGGAPREMQRGRCCEGRLDAGPYCQGAGEVGRCE